jgi:hypothetical protein
MTPTSRAGLPVRPLAIAFLLGFAAGCGGGGGGGKPFFTEGGIDLAVDKEAVENTWEVVDRNFSDTHCAVVEGAVDAPGLRRLLRFDTVIVNHGTENLHIGSPTDPEPPYTTDDYVWSPCHGHYHLEGFSDYRLEDEVGGIVRQGHKQAFCLRDDKSYAGPLPSAGYDCSDQGITSGWGDTYYAALDGQWVDITGVPEGDYVLVVTINADGLVPEIDVFPNTAHVPVHVPDPDGPPDAP